MEHQHTRSMRAGIQQRLARNVQALHDASGMKKSAFALMLGISRPQLDLIEQGRCNMKLLNLEKLADRLGVTAADLIK